MIVTDPLNPSLFDLNTVSLGAITFGNVRITPPPGLSNYATTAHIGNHLLVNVAVSLDRFTGLLAWSFVTIDSVTGFSPPLAGFLPPNVTPPQGEGSVLFTVMPRSTLTHGAQLSNSAVINFDGVNTNTSAWTNTIDNGPPASHVVTLGAQSNSASIPVSWTADGATADLRDFTLYVSEDNAPYRVWRLNTGATSDTLRPPGNRTAHTYEFYSVARDIGGNIETAPGAADATTRSLLAVDGAPIALQLALEGARPNPATGALRVWFTLPGRDPASLDLLDVTGRRVLRREVGAMGPGSHSVALDAERPLRPGLYFLRLTQGSRVLSSRAAVMN